MRNRLSQLTKLSPLWQVRVLAVLFSLALVTVLFTPLWSSSHVLKNLEPYPDGLFYTNLGWNLAHGKGYRLEFQGYVALEPRVQPLYPVALAVGYLVWAVPYSFYVVNAVLAVLALLFIMMSAWNWSCSPLSAGVAGLLLLCQPLLWWYAQVPMAENLGVVLTSLAVLLLTKPTGIKNSLCLTVLGVAFFFTRYSYISLTAILWLLAVKRGWPHTSLRARFVVAIGAVAATFLGIITLPIPDQLRLAVNPWSWSNNTWGGQAFYSFSYFLPNVLTYGRALLGGNLPTLWTVSSVSFLGWGVLLGLARRRQLAKQQPLFIQLLLLLLSVLPPLLFFYVRDGRYILVVLPILVALTTLVLTTFKSKMSVVMAIAIVALTIVSQRHIARFVLSSNWRGSTTAWQYEAVGVLNNQLPDGSKIITALPPYLFSLYGTGKYAVLPLSSAQEFADKGQRAWGKEVEINLLPRTYANQVRSGEQLYVFSAYLSHNQKVSNEYQQYQSNFSLQPMTTSCADTCQLFLVKPL
jgi:hypothetical protein